MSSLWRVGIRIYDYHTISAIYENREVAMKNIIKFINNTPSTTIIVSALLVGLGLGSGCFVLCMVAMGAW